MSCLCLTLSNKNGWTATYELITRVVIFGLEDENHVADMYQCWFWDDLIYFSRGKHAVLLCIHVVYILFLQPMNIA